MARWIPLVAVAVVAATVAGVRLTARRPGPTRGMVYSANGYGGFVSAPARGAKPTAAPGDAVKPAETAYNAGRYREAEAMAASVIARAAATSDPDARRWGVRARMVTAFAAARRQCMATARSRFESARREAAALPDHGKRPAVAGRAAPSLEESAAYQHAVCAAALGDTRSAEAEWVALMDAYPESPLVHASVRRIARLHGGDIPAAADAAWKRAMAEGARRSQARQRDRSLCAPECLAEALRRRGEAGDVRALAREMGTDHTGTSLKALCAAARRRGIGGDGLALTQAGLERQRMPLMVLLAPGHFVIADKRGPAGIQVWDPEGAGLHRPARRWLGDAEWKRAWSGVAVTLMPRRR